MYILFCLVSFTQHIYVEFIHVVVVHLFLLLRSIPLFGYTSLLIHSPFEQSDCFYLLAIIKLFYQHSCINVCMNICFSL